MNLVGFGNLLVTFAVAEIEVEQDEGLMPSELDPRQGLAWVKQIASDQLAQQRFIVNIDHLHQFADDLSRFLLGQVTAAGFEFLY